jgi:hypothetical protein
MKTFTGNNYQLTLDDSLVYDFPPSSMVIDYYTRLACQRGQALKEEKRTSIRLLQATEDGDDRRSSSYVLKEYRYRLLNSIRTWWRMPKAEREYLNLRRFMTLGIPPVEPVGFGVKRGWGGTIHSCFLITRLAEDTVDLRTWLINNKRWQYGSNNSFKNILKKLGGYLHLLHEMRFFILNVNVRNILIRGVDTTDPELVFLDLPLGRFLDVGPLARWAQKKDFGSLFGFLLRNESDTIVDIFLETYLPDPLGNSRELVRQDIIRATRRHNNQTLITGMTYRLKRAVKDLKRTLFTNGEKIGNATY